MRRGVRGGLRGRAIDLVDEPQCGRLLIARDVIGMRHLACGDDRLLAVLFERGGEGVDRVLGRLRLRGYGTIEAFDLDAAARASGGDFAVQDLGDVRRPVCGGMSGGTAGAAVATALAAR